LVIRDPWLKALVVIGCAIAGIYLVGLLWQVFQQFADIVLLFFFAWLVAFVLEPLSAALTRLARLPRLLAIALTYLALLVVVSVGVVLIVPALVLQIVTVAKNLPGYADQVTAWLTAWQLTTNDWLSQRGSPVLIDLASVLNPQALGSRLESLAPLLTNVVQFAAGFATGLGELVIMLILSFYFMVDGARIGERLIQMLPPRAQDDGRFLVANIHRVFAGFLRGQLIQALLGGVVTGIIMSALGVDYALLAAVMAGLVLLIPFLGPVAAVGLPLLVAIFTRPEAALLLFILLFLLQQLIFNVVAPRVYSQQVGLHPLLVFFAVLAGARVGGLWGAIFGVPIVAVILQMFNFYRAEGEEQVARLQEQLPGQELVSVELRTEVASTN
jgi:predicted PurR-regulated permease PerM